MVRLNPDIPTKLEEVGRQAARKRPRPALPKRDRSRSDLKRLKRDTRVRSHSRNYVFHLPAGSQPSAAEEQLGENRRRSRVGGIANRWRHRRCIRIRTKAVMGERDAILVTDFVNTTADPVFDGTLKKAVAVDLGQSPFLNVFPDQKVRQTLQYMGRSRKIR